MQVGWTPLIIASSAGHVEIVSYLLQLEGVNVNAVNSTGQTAMHYAASKDRFQVTLCIRGHFEGDSRENAVTIVKLCKNALWMSLQPFSGQKMQ